MPIILGTSGWQYRDWKGSFYPADLAQTEWLPFFSRCFATVEVNNTFYRLPERKTFEKWAALTPPDFVVTVKANRFLSHIKRLRDADSVVSKMMESVVGLGQKLGPILVQLPPTMKADLQALEATLRTFPKGVRVAVEFRHDSWFTEQTHQMLSTHDCAFVMADREETRLGPEWRTASWGYLRFHEGSAALKPCYTETTLETWARAICSMWSDEEDVFVYFNNDPNACAIEDAGRFARILKLMNRATTRVEVPEVKR